ncbi:MAG TPA: NfeD family protein [Spirochaetia bacterium]|nr:NfeD family protein [Spirochaetia bacterium]
MFSIPVFLWALAGLLLIGAELLVPGFVIFFFGVGALITAVLTGIIPGLSGHLGLQALLWLGSTGLFVGLLRKRFARIFRGTLLEGRGVGANDIGKKAIVTERISEDAPGRVRYAGTTWKAMSYAEPFEVGEEVIIIEKNNLTYTVTRSLLDDPKEE